MQQCTPSWTWHTRPPSCPSHPPSSTSSCVTPAKPDTQESKPHRIENGNASSQIFGDSYLPPGLGYTNRYIPYSVAENMSLQRLNIPGKGSVYPKPVLFGSSSFYPPHIAPKQTAPYGVHPYPSSQETPAAPMLSHPGFDAKDQLENKSTSQDEPCNAQLCKNQERVDADSSCKTKRDQNTSQTIKASGKILTSARDDVVCIDLVADETDEDLSTNKQSSFSTRTEDFSKHGSSGCNHIPERDPWLPKAVPPSQAVDVPTYGNSFPRGPSSQHLSNPTKGSFNRKPAGVTTELPDNREILCESPSPPSEASALTSTSSCGDRNEDRIDPLADEEVGPSCCNSQNSSLTNRITNSSTYVGVRFERVTTELHGDSSKLGREQRALQVREGGQDFFTPP
uniref:BCL6 corepressor n=1 Tax=Mastacembelus armatus TaxID=205130 RepID=A0A3Q3NCW4_9TELE